MGYKLCDGFFDALDRPGGAGGRSRLAKLSSASQPAEGLGASRGVHTLCQIGTEGVVKFKTIPVPVVGEYRVG